MSISGSSTLDWLRSLDGDARFVAGLDIGVSYDQSVLCVAVRLPVASLNPDRERRPVYGLVFHAWASGTPLHQVEEDVVSLQPLLAGLVAERNGVGAGPAQSIARALKGKNTKLELCHTDGPKKTAGVMTLLNLTERGQMYRQRDVSVERQFAGAQVQQGRRGVLHVENDPTEVQHDDFLDAAYLATWPYTGRKGVGTKLARWADPEHGLPDSDVRTSGGEVLTTGTGFRVWRNPPLQSTAGQGVTYPPGWQDQPRAERRLGNYRIQTKGIT